MASRSPERVRTSFWGVEERRSAISSPEGTAARSRFAIRWLGRSGSRDVWALRSPVAVVSSSS